MGRHQEFDQEEVLNRAMQIFWKKGYQSASMADLEKATGLGPGSIYNAFGSKKGMFLKVIDHYAARIAGHRIETILNAGEPLAAIEAFFRSTYEDAEADQLIGCLLTNTATEIGRTDADIQKSVATAIGRIETAFKERLTEARNAGSLDPAKDLTATAAHLAACYQGLLVISRLTRDKARLKTITGAALATLR